MRSGQAQLRSPFSHQPALPGALKLEMAGSRPGLAFLATFEALPAWIGFKILFDFDIWAQGVLFVSF